MDWVDLAVTVPVARVDEAADIAEVVATAGISIEDYSDLEQGAMEIAHIDLIDEDLIKKDRTHAILHLYLSPDRSPAEVREFLTARLDECGIEHSIALANVREEDWATAWKAYYHPIELSDKLVICPSWEHVDTRPGQQIICLDPGMAFGSGTHETTQLCLALMEKALRPGDAMLDVGCGSGILAICAKKLGAGRTVGVDIDEVAVRVAGENAEINACGDIEFVCGDLARDITGKFRVICANIVADAILRLAPDLPKLLDEGGRCIVSGIIDSRRDEVIAGLRAAGLSPVEIAERRGWVAIACERA